MSERNSVVATIDSALVLAGVPALLYVTGNAYYGGFLDASNLDPNLLDRSIYRALYDGMLAIFGSSIVFALVGGMVCLGLVAVLPFLLIRYGSEASNDLQGWISLRASARKNIMGRRVMAVGETAAVSLIALAVILLTMLAVMVQVERSGREEGKDIYNRLSKGLLLQSDLMTVEIGGDKRRLVHLACGSSYCAGMDPCSREVLYYEQGPRSFINTDFAISIHCGVVEWGGH